MYKGRGREGRGREGRGGGGGQKRGEKGAQEEKGRGKRVYYSTVQQIGRSLSDFAYVLMRVVELNECMRGMNARGGEGIECKGRGGE